MQVQQIVRASADVLTVTRLSPGDVYKRVDDSAYGGTPVLRFGVVQDVMNNGTDAAVSALEYVADFTEGVKVHSVVMNGAKPMAIFPAQPEELVSHLDELTRAADDAVRRAQQALDKAVEAQARVLRVREATGSLTAPETSTGVLDAVVVGEGPDDAAEGQQ